MITFRVFTIASFFFIFLSCFSAPEKKFYVLNYDAGKIVKKINPQPYPFTIRIKEFDIEKAYSKSQIVYRKSPYELQYYFYRVWAVGPTRMISDMVEKHLVSANVVSHVTRRYDEGFSPNYELTGIIEAIEEYDSEEVWFAHLAIRFELMKMKNNVLLYSKKFDKRKKVVVKEPEYVVRELSNILEMVTGQMIIDIDSVLFKEHSQLIDSLEFKAK